MLGTIRFFLALLVLISHVPSSSMRLNLGVVSVILFYFISGFLMQKSYSRFVDNSANPVLDFYIDRVLKLFPQYIVIVIITFVSVIYFGNSKLVPIINQDITPYKVFLNVILILNNYVFEPFIIEGLTPHPIIPPTWSLSTELHFYLILPFIFFLKKRVFFILLLSIIIQFSSFLFSSHFFNSNNFGYRYIFGTLTIFIYGYSFSKENDLFFRNLAISIWVSFGLFLFVLLPTFILWENPLLQEILLGGFIALPLGYYFVYIKIQFRNFRKIDTLLGNLAYPIFITHFLAFYLVEKLLIIDNSYLPVFYISSIFLCLLISFLLHIFQIYIEKIRLRRRGFLSLREKNFNAD